MACRSFWFTKSISSFYWVGYAGFVRFETHDISLTIHRPPTSVKDLRKWFEYGVIPIHSISRIALSTLSTF